MIRFIKMALLVVIAVALVTIAMANRDPATLTLLTPELADLVRFNISVTQPMFVIVFASVVTGLLIGYLLEWLRESKHRQEVGKRQQQVRDLKREVTRLRGKVHEGEDEVLALLEDTAAKPAG